MTFPFSMHNYQLRYWMAAGGAVPDEDVRLVVLPPPFMVESLAKGHVDGFCVGAPWNSIAVREGLGRILHFGVDIFARAVEKVLAVRETFANEKPATVAALTRAHMRAAEFVNAPENLDEVASILARADRVGVDAETIRRTLTGRMRLSHDGVEQENENYLIIAKNGAGRPDPVQAAWLYAQMLRWGQTRGSQELLAAAKRTFRADLYDAACGARGITPAAPRDPIGAASGPVFDADRIDAYLAAFDIGLKR
jgi:NitT/TauT family transport system ATP-binding protein